VVRGRHRPPIYFTHPVASTAIGGGKFQGSLHIFRITRKPSEAILGGLRDERAPGGLTPSDTVSDIPLGVLRY
jgi:hypothetical protein